MGEFAADLPKSRIPALGLRSLGDDRLGRLAASGDARAFEVVYQRHHQALYRYCRSLLGNSEDAADALQSTMAAALRGLQGEKREIRLKPWLFRIAHNECVSMLRARRPQTVIDDSLELAAPEGADLATRERLRQLVADLQELPEGQRGALVMRELSGLSYEEIAAVLGGSVPAARQAVFEARSALHELAEGRAMECESVRLAVSERDGRVLRGRRLRAHLRACGSCRDFQALIGTRRRDLAAIAPPIPAALAAGLLHHIVGGGAASAGGGGGAGIGGSLAAGKAVVASGALKTAAIVAATAAVSAGTVETVRHATHRHAQPKPVPAAQGAAAAKAAAASAHGGAAASAGKPVVVPLRTTVTHSGGVTVKHGGAKEHHGAQAGTPGRRLGASKPQKQHGGGRQGTHHRSDKAPPKGTHPSKPTHPEHPATPAPQSSKPKGPPAVTTPTLPTLPPQANGKVGQDHGQSDITHGNAPVAH